MKRNKILTLDELPDILSPQLFADYVGINRGRVYAYCSISPEAGGIESFTIGNSRKIEKVNLLKWIENQKSLRVVK